MASHAPPTIFSQRRRIAARHRMFTLQRQTDAARYILSDMIEDVLERLAFLRREPARALIIGEWTGELAAALRSRGAIVEEAEPAHGFCEELPFADTGFDFIASLGTLDTVNDLPGALIHIRNALAPGGMMIASFMGAGSLPMLRQAMLTADGDRPAPRIHPQVDVRAGGQLLQRTGFSDPVIDSRPFDVAFRSMDSLVADLRAQGIANVLADPGPPLSRTARARAAEAFSDMGTEGRTVERFEILTLSGWKR